MDLNTVFEVCLDDLQNDEDQHYREVRLCAEDIQGKNILTDFWRRPTRLSRLVMLNLAKIRQTQRKMTEIMINQATSCDLKELVQKFIPEVIGKEIEKPTSSTYPLQNVFIRKVKILKAPKFDLWEAEGGSW